jgi:hypothetical protein
MPGPLNVHGGTGELIVSNAGTVFANGDSLPTGPGFATGCPFIKTGDDAGLYVNYGTYDTPSFQLPDNLIIAGRYSTATVAGAALVAAVDAISSTGQTIYVQGNFSLANQRLLLDFDETKLIAVGACKLTLTSSGTYEHVVNVTADYCLVQGIEVDWNNQAAPTDPQGARCIEVSGDYNVVRNCIVRNTPGAAATGVAEDIRLNGTYNICEGCRSYDSGNHAFLDGGDYNIFRDVFAEGCDEDTAYASNPPANANLTTLIGLRGTGASGAFNFNGDSTAGEDAQRAVIRDVNWVSTGDPSNNAKVSDYLHVDIDNCVFKRGALSNDTNCDLRIDSALNSLSISNSQFDAGLILDDIAQLVIRNTRLLVGYERTRGVTLNAGTHVFDGVTFENIGNPAGAASGVGISHGEAYTSCIVRNCTFTTTRTFAGGNDFAFSATHHAPGNLVWLDNALVDTGTGSISKSSDSVLEDTMTQQGIDFRHCYDDGTMTTPPASKAWPVGYRIYEASGGYWECVVAGTPGTWIGRLSGSGDPENTVAAPVGSTWMRTDGGALTTLYVKESGTGNTGWVGK